MSTINVYKKNKIDLTKYVNVETGELLSSEQPNITSVLIRSEDLRIVTTEEYITIDSKALRYIQTILSKADLEKLLRMSNMVGGIYNLLHDVNGVRHIPKTLRFSLDYDESEFSRFMARLHKQSIIHYLQGYKDGKKMKWIMLNPRFARKNKRFHNGCLSVFDDLSKRLIPGVKNLNN